MAIGLECVLHCEPVAPLQQKDARQLWEGLACRQSGMNGLDFYSLFCSNQTKRLLKLCVCDFLRTLRLDLGKYQVCIYRCHLSVKDFAILQDFSEGPAVHIAGALRIGRKRILQTHPANVANPETHGGSIVRAISPKSAAFQASHARLGPATTPTYEERHSDSARSST